MSEINTQRLVEDLKQIAHDAEELLKATADAAGERVSELRERLKGVADKARETCQRLEERARSQAETADKVIKSHPYESIGIAFGLGVLLGVLIGRR